MPAKPPLKIVLCSPRGFCAGVVRAIDTVERKDRLVEAIESLPDRERLVIALSYYETLTLREIGEVLGVTESRVSQLHTKAVLGMRGHLQNA